MLVLRKGLHQISLKKNLLICVLTLFNNTISTRQGEISKSSSEIIITCPAIE